MKSTFTKSVKGMPGSLVAALRYLFGQYDEKFAEDFFQRLGSGERLTRDNPILMLRNRLLTAEHLSQVECAALTIKAWNSFVMGEPLTVLRFRNVTIRGASGFSIGPGAVIKGNLSVSGVASGSTKSQICSATISGTLTVDANAIPIKIGDPVNYCYSNTVGQNATITNNTAAVSVNSNSVKQNLSCSGNATITGSANTAQKKLGQCSAF